MTVPCDGNNNNWVHRLRLELESVITEVRLNTGERAYFKIHWVWGEKETQEKGHIARYIGFGGKCHYAHEPRGTDPQCETWI